jgi:hypothetical protein
MLGTSPDTQDEKKNHHRIWLEPEFPIHHVNDGFVLLILGFISDFPNDMDLRNTWNNHEACNDKRNDYDSYC